MNILQEFIPLALAHILAVASPGPDFAVVTKNTISYGKKYGRITALGVGIAILLHVTYAVLGFSVLVKSNPIVFNIIKYLGAAFLLYLGYKSLQPAGGSQEEIDANDETKGTTLVKSFRQGFLTNALNVKAMLFFLFLFTSLVSETTTLPIKIFYGGWLSLMTYVWFFGIASFIGWAPVRNFFLKWGSTFDKIMGVILIVLALILVFK